MTQVVIIGAGPTGLTLAMLLAQRGINVKLIEASRSFRRIFRGEALMPSGLEAIERMGLSDVVEQIPHRAIDAWEFYIENRPIFRVDEPMESGGQPCTLISQPALLEAVLARASKLPQIWSLVLMGVIRSSVNKPS
jgi:2-polyprenyl-6-methoxyphenol hydroxylase-like FAD-dependent oxidoreductase